MPLHNDIANIEVWGSSPADVDDFSDAIVDDLSDTGWGASYSPPGTDRPEREGFNTQFRRLTRLAVEQRQSGSGLEWDARVIYHRDAICRYLNIHYVALQMNSNMTPSTSTAHWRVMQDGRFTPQNTIPLNRMVNGTTGHVLIYDANGVLSTTSQQTGGQGSPGNNGWSPTWAIVSSGLRRVLRVVDWVGGQGTKPTTGQYIGSSGLVNSINSAIDIRGPQGILGWGETPVNAGVEDSMWVYTQPDYRNAVQGTRISLAGYSNVALSGLSIDSSTMYVLDETNSEIALFSLSGAFQSVISIGAGDVQGLSVSGGLAYVVDNTADEVVVYNLSGVEQSSFSLGSGNSQGISVSGGFIYVVQSVSQNNSVHIYNTSGTLQRSLTGIPGFTRGISVSGSLMYILDGNVASRRVLVFDLNGNQQGSFNLPTGGTQDHSGISVSGGTLYVLDDDANDESVIPYTTPDEVVTALGQRVSGSWERREFGIG